MAASASAQTNQGRDFWLAETTNTLASGSVFAIAIANPNPGPANIVIAHDGDADLLDVIPSGSLDTYTFPRRTVCTDGGVNLGKDMVYHVTSDVDVVVYIFNPLETIFTNDASLILPVPALGQLHRAGSYVNPNGNSSGSFVGIVAVQDGTNVQTFDRAGTLIDNVVVNKGEYFQRVSGGCFGGVVADDTTGWRVVTSVPAVVFSGSNCTSLGNSTGACDHLEEQIIPEEAVAATYVACPTLTRPPGCTPTTPGSCAPDVFRYVATVANTAVTTSPNVGGGVLANPGDFLEITTATPHVVTADKPIYGYQYLISQDSGSPTATIGDPAMLDMPPVDQFQFRYIFLAPTTYDFDFINLVAPVGTAFTLDGSAVSDTCNPVGTINGVEYCCLGKPVGDGVHTVSATNRFGLSVSGFDDYASYAYIGGLGLQPINAGCNTGGPYQLESCMAPANVPLNGTPSCSDGSTPTVLWSSPNGVTFSDPTSADPTATVPGFGTFDICMQVACPDISPVNCCSTIALNQGSNCECVPVPEICDNGVDDDCDLLIDCNDEANCMPMVPPCRIKRDPSSIRFDKTGSGADYFRSHGRVDLKASVDVSSVDVGWMVSHANGLVWSTNLPAGSLINTSGGSYMFGDDGAGRGAGKHPGIYRARILVNGRGTAYYWVKAYGDFSRATEPQMTIQMHIGDQWFGLAGQWRQTHRGWHLKPTPLEQGGGS